MLVHGTSADHTRWARVIDALSTKFAMYVTTHTQIVARYRELAEKLDARGHIAIAKQLAAEPTFAA